MQGALENRLEQLSHFRRIAGDPDSALLHDGQLLLRRSLPTGDDCASMAHALAWRSRNAGDKADHGFFHVGFYPTRTGLLGVAADLAHHDHRIGVGVVVEHLHDVDVLQSVDRVAADADTGRLAQPALHQLTDRFVRQCSRARDDADAALLVYLPGHDADLDFIGRDDAWTVGTDEDGVFALHAVTRANHVPDRYAFGDADDQVELGVDSLVDGGSGKGRGHVDDGDGRSGAFLGFLHGAVDRNTVEALTRLVGIHAGNKAVRAVGVVAAHAGVEGSSLARDALGHDLGVPADGDAHGAL